MPSLRALLDLPLATKIESEGRYGIGRIFYLVAKGKHWDDLKALLQTQLAPLLPAQGEHSTLTLLKMMAEELSGGAREAGGASGAGTG